MGFPRTRAGERGEKKRGPTLRKTGTAHEARFMLRTRYSVPGRQFSRRAGHSKRRKTACFRLLYRHNNTRRVKAVSRDSGGRPDPGPDRPSRCPTSGTGIVSGPVPRAFEALVPQPRVSRRRTVPDGPRNTPSHGPPNTTEQPVEPSRDMASYAHARVPDDGSPASVPNGPHAVSCRSLPTDGEEPGTHGDLRGGTRHAARAAQVES